MVPTPNPTAYNLTKKLNNIVFHVGLTLSAIRQTISFFPEATLKLWTLCRSLNTSTKTIGTSCPIPVRIYLPLRLPSSPILTLYVRPRLCYILPLPPSLKILIPISGLNSCLPHPNTTSSLFLTYIYSLIWDIHVHPPWMALIRPHSPLTLPWTSTSKM